VLEAPPLGELDGLLAEGLELAPLLGELDAPELGGVLDAPPEADPDAEPEADPLGDFAGSDALELDELGELEAPLEGDDEELLEPELDGGGVVALPLELLLEPVAPGPRPWLLRLQMWIASCVLHGWNEISEQDARPA
jgi:hypothetical protein